MSITHTHAVKVVTFSNFEFMQSSSSTASAGDAAVANSSSSSSSSSLIDGVAILDALQLASHEHLGDVQRSECPQCKQKRKYFCYSCGIALGDARLTPRVQLPVRLHIVYHASECDGKATSTHARVLCGDDQVTHSTYPDVPAFDAACDVVLFPSDDAVLLDELSDAAFAAIRRVVVLDCQWHVVKKLEKHASIAALRRVRIRSYSTTFWRYQNVGPECLATIEAIYYFYREHGTRALAGKYDGRYDNLLYFYKFFYELIQHNYKTQNKPFTKRHVADYVRHDRPVAIDVVRKIPIMHNGKPIAADAAAAAESASEQADPAERDPVDHADKRARTE